MNGNGQTDYSELNRDRLNAVQELLQDVMLDMARRRRASGKRAKISDNSLARELRVNSGTLNQWINGNRMPSYQNCVILSQHPMIGDKIWDIMGYDKPTIPANTRPGLLFINENFNLLSDADQEEIVNAMKELLHGDRRPDIAHAEKERS